MAACHVYGRGDANIRDLLSPDLRDEGFQFPDIDIAFEWEYFFRIVCFINNDIYKRPAGEFLMGAGRREIHIPRNKIPGLNQNP